MTGAAPCRPDVIALVADASATPVACSGADWEKLVADAVQHGLAPLLYRHARHATTPPSQGITGVLRRHYLENAAANMRVFHELADVLSVLGAGGVEAAPLKGACLAERVYGDIALRPMRDIDLLVKLADLTRAIRLLREAGYDASQTFDPRARLADFHDMLPMARPGGSVVEMHWTLVTPQSPARIDDRELEGLWSRTGPETFAGVPARMLAPEDLLLHLCIHASVHHRFSQVRLRAFVDIAEVGRRFKDTLDWAAVAARANRWRVANGVRMALMLAEEWTDLAVPESVWNALDGERPDDEHLIWARHKVRRGRTGRAQKRVHRRGVTSQRRGQDQRTGKGGVSPTRDDGADVPCSQRLVARSRLLSPSSLGSLEPLPRCAVEVAGERPTVRRRKSVGKPGCGSTWAGAEPGRHRNRRLDQGRALVDTDTRPFVCTGIRTSSAPGANGREPTTMSWLILLIISWGALAFGAIYDWARWPLLVGCVVTGMWGFGRRVPRERKGVNGPILAGLALVALAVCVQLVPLDSHTLRRWSPATDAFLRQYDLLYALPAVEDSAESQSPNPESRPSPSIPFSGAVTHALSINPPKTWVGLACLASFGFMLLGLARGLGGRDLRALAPGIVALGLLMSMIGIVQKALWNGKVYGFWEPINKGAVAFGPFINRNHFAGWMLLALPIAAGYFASLVAKGMVGVKPGWRNRMIWFSTPEASRAVLTAFAILVMGFALTFTLSRSGISCFLLAMVLSAFNVLRRQTTTKGRLLGTYMMFVFAVAMVWVGIDAIGTRFAQVNWELGGRAGAWADAWRIHQAFRWFGTGLNTYGSATLLLQQFEKATAHYVEAHNDYLQLLVEGGWLVALPALVLLVLFVWEVGARFREGRDDRTGYWLRLGAVTGLVAIAFQEIVEFSLQMPGNAAFFTVLCAVAVRKASVKGVRERNLSRIGPR